MKMYCNQCKKDVTAKNNKCPYCGMSFDLDVVDDVKEMKTREKIKKNIISTIFNWIGVILLIIGLLLTISILFGTEIRASDVVYFFLIGLL